MECHNRVLVVLEGRVWILLVDNTLTRELLIVVGDLDGKDTRIVYLCVGDDKLAIVIDVWNIFISA